MSKNNKLLQKPKISPYLVLHEIGQVDGHPIYCITGGKGPRVLLTGGIHGNEPAGALALLEFVQGPIEKYLDSYSFTIIPWINPVGLQQNTRKNKEDIDLNRQFFSADPTAEVKAVKKQIHGEFVFSLDHHEDPTDEAAASAPDEIPPEEVYLYEISLSSKGRVLLDAIESAGYPICKRASIYNDPCDKGLLWLKEVAQPVGNLYEYAAKHTSHAFTLETPTCWSIEDRVRVHLIALDTALRLFQQDRE